MDRFEAAARGAYTCFRSAGGKLIIVKRLWACYMEKALYNTFSLQVISTVFILNEASSYQRGQQVVYETCSAWWQFQLSAATLVPRPQTSWSGCSCFPWESADLARLGPDVGNCLAFHSCNGRMLIRLCMKGKKGTDNYIKYTMESAMLPKQMIQ